MSSFPVANSPETILLRAANIGVGSQPGAILGKGKHLDKKELKRKGKIEINQDLCKGCGICIAFCQKKVLELDERDKAAAVRPEECNACTLCELRCPDMALEIKKTEGE